ncbi:MAG: excinuclease ABC subunit UvrC [Verrucomicrobia bacterium]|jgi:excinuclease ABC subunit C|nr:excinuclease ABC subunit UvrC [Verrucomicrobiota bacterium]
MPETEAIRNKLRELPHRPGVYLMKDRFGTVIYVGKARDLRKRVSQYFHPSRRLGWDLKFQALVDAIHDLDVHVVRSEPEALLLESKLIKEFHPRYNVSFRDDKRFPLVKVNLNDSIPRFTLTRLKTEDGARYFGPFPNGGALRSTLVLMRRKFNLRGCRPLTPTEADYRHCLYGNLKWCTAPCIGNVAREQYLAQVRAACDFLDGQCEELAGELEESMRKAALAREYEKAAELRDLLENLKSTTRKTVRFERTPWNLPVARAPAEDNAELARALGLPAPPRRIEGFDVSNISGTLKVASVVSFRDGRPDRAHYRRMKIQSVEGQDDFACIAEAVRRRYTRLLKESAGRGAGSVEGKRPPLDEDAEAGRAIVQELREMTASAVMEPRTADNDPPPSNLPDLIVIDGGKGQLNAACAELGKLGLERLPIIGLAKEFEEIYRPGRSTPLRLSHDNNALKLLQRIRDESHRVANSYNAQLRLRKISESVLDEFPGIGEARKSALLRRFGSIQRLRTATVEQIAAVPGFGSKSAEDLRRFLEARS